MAASAAIATGFAGLRRAAKSHVHIGQDIQIAQLITTYAISWN